MRYPAIPSFTFEATKLQLVRVERSLSPFWNLETLGLQHYVRKRENVFFNLGHLPPIPVSLLIGYELHHPVVFLPVISVSDLEKF